MSLDVEALCIAVMILSTIGILISTMLKSSTHH